MGESAALAVALDAPATATAGGPLRWTLTVRNGGPSTARDVDLALQLPAGVRGVRVDDDRCSTAVDCRLGDLAPGEVVVVVVTGTLDPASTAAELDATATVTSPTADPSSVDDTATATTAVGRAADLVTTLDLRPTTLVPGTGATLTLGVRNDGLSDADRVLLSTTLPAGLELAGDVTGADCSLTGRTLVCAVPVLGPGADVAVTVPLAVAPGLAVASLDLSAAATSATPEAAPDDNTAALAVPVAGQADLTLTKTGPARASAGTPLAWRLVLTNAGPSDAQGVVLTDLLPPGAGAVTATASQGVCTQDGGELRCAVGTLADGGRVTVDLVTAQPLDPGAPTGDLTNTAQVSSPTGEPGGGTGGRTDAVTTVLGAEADVAVDVAAASTSVVAGTDVRWTVTVLNRGPATARGVRVELPADRALTDVVVTGPAGVVCEDGVCTLDALGVGDGAAVVLTVTGRVPAAATADEVALRAAVTSRTDDAVAGNDEDAAAVPVVRTAGLSVTKTGAAVVTPGGTVAWTVVVGNAGPSVARDVVLTDVLPAGVTDVEVEGADCTGTDEVRCALGTLLPGTTTEVTLTGTLAAGFEADALVNTAEVTSSTSDPDAGDNSATARGDAEGLADLAVTKTGPDDLVAGGPVRWVLAVTNDGPSTARDVVLTDAVPAGVGSLRATGTGCSVADQVVRCALGDVPDGGSAEVVVTGVVDPGYRGAALVNSASVRSATADPVPGNGTSDPVSSAVTRSADVSVTKTVDAVVAGEDATFTLTVRNAGPSTARDVVVTDDLPAGMTAGAVTGADCAVVEQQVRCELGELGLTGDDPVVITVPVAVADDVDADTFSNTATVLGGDPDPDPEDNQGTADGDAAALADLSVTKETDARAFVPGGQARWTLTARNDGPSAARAVTVVDRLPADLLDATATLRGGPAEACAVDAGVATCTVPLLRDGGSAVVEVSGRFGAEVEGAEVTNSATVQLVGEHRPGRDGQHRRGDDAAGRGGRRVADQGARHRRSGRGGAGAVDADGDQRRSLDRPRRGGHRHPAGRAGRDDAAGGLHRRRPDGALRRRRPAGRGGRGAGAGRHRGRLRHRDAVQHGHGDHDLGRPRPRRHHGHDAAGAAGPGRRPRRDQGRGRRRPGRRRRRGRLPGHRAQRRPVRRRRGRRRGALARRAGPRGRGDGHRRLRRRAAAVDGRGPARGGECRAPARRAGHRGR